MRCGFLALAAALLLANGANAATLVHDYEFGTASTTNFYDSIVGGTDGTLFNGANVSGGYLHLDGSNDYARFDDLVFPAGNTAFSVFFTFENHTTNGNYYEEVVSQDGGSFYIGQIGNDTRISDAHGSVSVPFPMDGNRYNYLLTNNGSIAALTINGTEIWSGSAVASTASGGYAYIGKQYSCCGEYFQGDIDTVRIFDGVVSYDEALHPLAAPEPASWAMLVGGFGLTGGALRRATRRKLRYA